MFNDILIVLIELLPGHQQEAGLCWEVEYCQNQQFDIL
jgi:hypothetical protein